MSAHKICIAIFSAALLLLGCSNKQKQATAPIERGAEWLSWSSKERDSYVRGFIDGYLRARLSACEAADMLFEVGQPHRLGDENHPTEVPSGRCLAAVDTYSRFRFSSSVLDLSVYTKPITEFYSKHTEYQDVPFPFLLQDLSDKQAVTSDQLYKLALEGKVHAIR